MKMKMIDRWIAGAALAALGACSDPERAAVENVSSKPPNAVVVRNASSGNEVTSQSAGTASLEPIAYTSLKPADCKLLEQNVDEGGYSRHLCRGIAGYAIETSESDLRQGLTVIAPGGRRTEIDLSARVANGAFNALGPTAEWRGKNREAPSALIVRLNVTKPEQAPDTSNLVVVRLGDPTCISSVVPPGPRQNEMARRQAEAEPPACLRT